MKVILCEDVDNLGVIGETVDVKPGYARNFLIPRRYAVAAESASAKQIEHEMRIIRQKEEKMRKERASVRDQINGLKLEFIAKASDEGKLFGSVTSLHVADKLRELGYDINRKRIVLKEPLKSLGEHEVPVNLATGIEATLKVDITRETSAEEAVRKEEEAEAKPEEILEEEAIAAAEEIEQAEAEAEAKEVETEVGAAESEETTA